MEKSIKSSAINYGLYLGIALALLSVIAYAIDLSLMTKFWYGSIYWIAIIVMGILSVANSKKLLNGFISFKDCLGSWVLTISLGLVISTLVSFIIFGVIDPDAAKQLQQLTIESSIAMMEGFNTPPEAIAEAVERMEQQNNYSIGNMLLGTVISIVIFTIIGLIVSAFMKKSDPDA
jgi:hypothetical protein